MRKLALFLIILTTGIHGYWKNYTHRAQGKRKILEGKTYIYLAPYESFSLKVKKKSSFKLVFKEKKKKEILVLKNKKKYKRIKTEAKKIKIYLRKGNYIFKNLNEKDILYVRIFKWRKNKLKSVKPVGGGYPLTLLYKDKKYSYYRITKDTVCEFKIKGPQTVYLYVRPDFGKKGKRIYRDFLLEVYDNNKKIISKKLKGRPSKKYIYMENKNIIPGKAEKFEIEIDKGIHVIKVKFKKGKGSVKCYIKDKKKKKKRKRTEMKVKKEILLGLNYDSNVFNLSQNDITDFLNGLKTYKFTHVNSIDDLYLTPSLNLGFLYGNSYRADILLKLFVYTQNKNKSYFLLNFSFLLKKKFNIKFSINWIPVYAYRPVYLLDYAQTFLLKYSRINSYMEFTFKNSYSPRIRAGITYYKFLPSDIFSYLDAVKYFVKAEINYRKKTFSILPSFGIYYTGTLNPNTDRDWKNLEISPSIGFKIKYFTVTFGVRYRNFLTDNPLDNIHYSRQDLELSVKSSIRFKISKKYQIGGFVYLFQRSINTTQQEPVLLLKEYSKFKIGMDLKISI